MKGKSLDYRVCRRCVMDTTARNIQFDLEGNCNFCSEFLTRRSSAIGESREVAEARLADLVRHVKQQGKKRRYDCIVGVSGGVDSSWSLVRAVELGLRPLAVHMDNGWNSELAQHNISRLIKTLNVDLVTHVIEWDEYRNLMQAFFDADVIDVELLYDNAMLKVNYSQARRWRTRTILSGSNQSTEGMLMPEGWNWQKIDRKNIRSIGLSQNVKLSSFPSIGVPDYLFYRSVSRIKWVPFLDFLNYNKEDSLNYLERNFEFKRYPYKHYESVFTRFYQGYLLPEKFGIDKRRLHLSNLVITKQLTREEALSRLQENPYPSIRDLQMDIRYFLKKMEWDEDDLSNYLSRAERPHDEWGSEVGRWRFIVGVNKKLRWMRPS